MDALTLIKNNPSFEKQQDLSEDLVSRIEVIVAFSAFLDYLKMIAQYPAYGYQVRKLQDAFELFVQLNPKHKTEGELKVYAKDARKRPPTVKELVQHNNPFGYNKLRNTILANDKSLKFGLEQCRPAFVAFFKKNETILKSEPEPIEETEANKPVKKKAKNF